jgi:hypothetical protein
MNPALPDTADLVDQSIEVLTALARQTRVRGAGTPAKKTEPVDFADLAAHVLTSVAANLGSVETLLTGRPGSWEADLVRRLVDGTAGADGELIRWRTEPVRLQLDTVDTLNDFGIADLCDEEAGKANERAGDHSLTDAQREEANELTEEIQSLWEQDEAAYAAAYLTTAQRYLTERGATCGVEFAVVPPYAQMRWKEGLAEQVHEYARRHTPLPMTGSAPDWTDGLPADALRRAGLTYTARAEAR